MIAEGIRASNWDPWDSNQDSLVPEPVPLTVMFDYHQFLMCEAKTKKYKGGEVYMKSQRQISEQI